MSEENKNSEFSFENESYRKTYWHTCSHILAQAVKRLYPEVKLAIGPSIDEGFYYDMDSPFPFTPEILEKLEGEMRKICKEKLKLERFELPREEALKFMEEREEPYKVELINDLPADAHISFYKQGEFVDLCAGPHLDSTGRIKGNAIKLTACNAAYWRGDSSRQTLQRIYGVAFPKKEELDAYLKEREEALKRDHNKLGRELEYFTTVDCIGQGLPILLPKGARVIQQLQRWVEDTEEKAGYLLTKTPLMAKRDLYKISGHWDHYLDGMFVLGDPYDETKECFALRPMTCPFQYQVYLNRQRSYRDLPMRLGETSTLFRNEDSGEMHGLIRVRQFTISEGHLVLRPDQLEEEFKGCLALAKYCLGTVGLLEKCTFRFSQWDPANPNNKYEGTAEQWDHAQAAMERMKIDEDMPIESKMLTRSIQQAQTTVESRNFQARKSVLEYDDVMNKQREIIYGQRRQVLEGMDVKDVIMNMMNTSITHLVQNAFSGVHHLDMTSCQELLRQVEGLYFPKYAVRFTQEQLDTMDAQAVIDAFTQAAAAYYQQKEDEFTPPVMREVERVVLLRVVDEYWMEHIDAMSDLRQGIRLRAYAQTDPIIAYKKESLEMFEEMIAAIQDETVRRLYSVRLQKNEEVKRQRVANATSESVGGDGTVKKQPRKVKKIGRNEPCPCGSGKKYKNCCGRNA